jgi:serine/threonine protein phosphatase PrpC
MTKKKDTLGKRSLDYLTDDEIVSAIKAGFFSLDKRLHEENAKNEQDRSGTTAVCALITPKNIYLINCGDSRGILVREDSIELCTYDHKPTQLKERQRIQNAGGIVALSRVNGGLATSRGLGDFEYKSVPNFKPSEQFVTCEPDIYIAKRDPRDKFIVLACDGIWDVVKNEEVSDFVNLQLNDTSSINVDVLTNINDKLLDHCFEKVGVT